MIPLAGVLLTVALQAAPANLADAYYLFFQGRSLEGKGDVAGAIAAYKRAAELEPASSAIHAELAGVYARAGKAADAVSEAEAALRLNKDDREAHRILGLVQAAVAENQRAGTPGQQQMLTDAAGHLEQALLGARDPGAELTLGRVDVELNRLDKAIVVLRNFLLDNPNYPEGVMLLAEAYEQSGQIDDAINTLKPLAETTDGQATGKPALAQLYERANRWTEAAALWGAMAAATPNDPAYRIQQASALLNGGQAAAGRDILLAAVKLKPQDISILYLLAQAEHRAGNVAGAESAAKQIAAVDPADPRGPLAMAEAKEAADDPNGVITVLKPLYDARLAANKNDDEVLGFVALSMADAYHQLAQLDASEAILRELVSRQPANDVALNALGYLLADRGTKLDEAETLLTRALAIDPDNWSYLDSLGWALFKHGKPAEAIAPLERAHKTAPRASLVADHLGDVYFAAKRYKDAADSWTLALAGDGDNIDRAEVTRKRDKARDLIK